MNKNIKFILCFGFALIKAPTIIFEMSSIAGQVGRFEVAGRYRMAVLENLYAQAAERLGIPQGRFCLLLGSKLLEDALGCFEPNPAAIEAGQVFDVTMLKQSVPVFIITSNVLYERIITRRFLPALDSPQSAVALRDNIIRFTANQARQEVLGDENFVPLAKSGGSQLLDTLLAILSDPNPVVSDIPVEVMFMTQKDKLVSLRGWSKLIVNCQNPNMLVDEEYHLMLEGVDLERFFLIYTPNFRKPPQQIEGEALAEFERRLYEFNILLFEIFISLMNEFDKVTDEDLGSSKAIELFPFEQHIFQLVMPRRFLRKSRYIFDAYKEEMKTRWDAIAGYV